MHLAYRWFTRLDFDQEIPDHSTFSKNRRRLLDHEMADRFFAAVVTQAKLRRTPVARRASPGAGAPSGAFAAGLG